MNKTTRFAEAVMTVELAAERIYRKQAASRDPGALRSALERLAEDEAHHAELARSLAGKPATAAALGAAQAAVGKLIGFILEQSDAAGRRFEHARSDWDLYNAALAMEKDSVLLYGTMMSKLVFAPLKKQIEQVLLQEKNHFDTLWTLRSAADRTGGSRAGQEDAQARRRAGGSPSSRRGAEGTAG